MTDRITKGRLHTELKEPLSLHTVKAQDVPVCWVPTLTNMSISNWAHLTVVPIKFVGNTKLEGLCNGECLQLKKRPWCIREKKSPKPVRLN